MPENPRAIIREAFVQMLKTPDPQDPQSFPTDAKARWHNSRDFPLDARVMPTGVAYTVRERTDPDYRHESGIRRKIMELRAEYYHTGDAAGDLVDEGAWQIENAVHASPTLGNLVESCHLTDTDIAFAEQGDFALFTAVMTFEITYYTHVQEDEEGRPTIVLLGFDPETGPGHEPDYEEIFRGTDA